MNMRCVVLHLESSPNVPVVVDMEGDVLRIISLDPFRSCLMILAQGTLALPHSGVRGIQICSGVPHRAYEGP